MASISIAPHILVDLERAAAEQHASVEAVLAEAVQRYLWDQRRHAIGRECAAYRRRHAELRRQYDGQFVAMRQGEVVASGPDGSELLDRVRRQLGDVPVMITRVTDTPEVTLSRRGFTLQGDGA